MTESEKFVLAEKTSMTNRRAMVGYLNQSVVFSCRGDVVNVNQTIGAAGKQNV